MDLRPRPAVTVRTYRMAAGRRFAPGFYMWGTCPAGVLWEVRWTFVHNSQLTTSTAAVGCQLGAGPTAIDYAVPGPLAPGASAFIESDVVMLPGDQLFVDFRSGTQIDVWVCGFRYPYPPG